MDVGLERQGLDVVMTLMSCSESKGDSLQLGIFSEFGRPWMGLASHVAGPLDPKFGHDSLNWGRRPLFSESIGDALNLPCEM